MKPAIIGPIAFIVGVAGGTFLAKAPPAPVDQGADSTHVASPSTTGEGHGADTSVILPPEGVADTGAHEAAPVEHPREQGVTPAGFDPTKLAQILDKLPPADVPLLVMQFTDEELVQVLRLMSVSHSAAVIAALPKDRAAIISKRLVMSGGMQ